MDRKKYNISKSRLPIASHYVTSNFFTVCKQFFSVADVFIRDSRRSHYADNHRRFSNYSNSSGNGRVAMTIDRANSIGRTARFIRRDTRTRPKMAFSRLPRISHFPPSFFLSLFRCRFVRSSAFEIFIFLTPSSRRKIALASTKFKSAGSNKLARCRNHISSILTRF